jgi:hypothetical protein
MKNIVFFLIPFLAGCASHAISQSGYDCGDRADLAGGRKITSVLQLPEPPSPPFLYIVANYYAVLAKPDDVIARIEKAAKGNPHNEDIKNLLHLVQRDIQSGENVDLFKYRIENSTSIDYLISMISNMLMEENVSVIDLYSADERAQAIKQVVVTKLEKQGKFRYICGAPGRVMFSLTDEIWD